MGTKLHQRSFALVMAVLFLATSVAFSAVVVYELTRDDETTVSQSTLEEALQSESIDELNSNNEQDQESQMLKGTQLDNFEPVAEASELQVIDLVEGNGEEVKEGATITAHYTGAYAVNGEIFESSKDGGAPATFPLGNVIEGWQEGVPGMKVGGTRRLIIPGEKAYGPAPDGYIPGSTDRPQGTLVFDIELVSIQ